MVFLRNDPCSVDRNVFCCSANWIKLYMRLTSLAIFLLALAVVWPIKIDELHVGSVIG